MNGEMNNKTVNQKAGEDKIMNKELMITQAMPFAKSCAYKFYTAHPQADLDDLISGAYYGLVKAANNYDIENTSGASFETYSRTYIEHELYACTGLPAYGPERDANRKYVELIVLNDQIPTAQELYDYCLINSNFNISLKTCEKVCRTKMKVVSIDQENPETEISLHNTLKSYYNIPDITCEKKETTQALMEALNELSEAEKNIIAYCYLSEFTNVKIGKILGMSAEGIRKKKMKALKKLSQNRSLQQIVNK